MLYSNTAQLVLAATFIVLGSAGGCIYIKERVSAVSLRYPNPPGRYIYKWVLKSLCDLANLTQKKTLIKTLPLKLKIFLYKLSFKSKT